MKRLTLALLIVLVAGLAAFRLQAGADTPTTLEAGPPGPPTLPERLDLPEPRDLPEEPPDRSEARDLPQPRDLADPRDEPEPPEARAAGGQAAQERPADEGARSSRQSEASRRSEASRQAEASDRGDSDRRSTRRWRRNRYPGPIPTPDEWVPPEGPVRIGLQVGHWRTEEAPPELSGLRGNGTRWGTMHEWQVNLEIARRTGAMLEELGYQVDLLPAVVPPGYRAHLFIAIHADGSSDPGATGFRVAAPGLDATGRASGVVELLERTYGESTGLPRVPTVTRRMRRYYAFNFRRYEHALHPMTIAVILETGYLTSPGDRRIIVDAPERAARGIVEAVKAFPHTPPPENVDRQ